jgi:hypothetical protein
MTYPRDELYREMAFIAYYLHWPPDQILRLPHGERRRWAAEVSGINRELSGTEEREWHG